ncbi:hypothetical protein MtrunA17_Chr4g0047881 [Medicago truncatula]|uniref:Transmembrane protein n=1 Tax=Medicago truncatula TaxID=3880 RepID=A0A396ICE1_MEDTR|nr:hypothetical protein MtrunA17_Chr4g0047881 [Medicago truncatula]
MKMRARGGVVGFGSHDLVKRVRFLGVVKILVCSPSSKGRKKIEEAFGVVFLLLLPLIITNLCNLKMKMPLCFTQFLSLYNVLWGYFSHPTFLNYTSIH